MLIYLHRKQFVSAWHITVHDMILNKALQRVDAVGQVLILPTILGGIIESLGGSIDGIINLCSQVVKGTQRIIIANGDAVLVELLQINCVWLNESGKAVLLTIGHPTHLRVSV